jgi:hypothetical protein
VCASAMEGKEEAEEAMLSCTRAMTTICFQIVNVSLP